jgi:hypothetical protein
MRAIDVGGDLDRSYGPSGIAWPALGGLAGQPFCELLGLGLAFTGADETDLAGGSRGLGVPFAGWRRRREWGCPRTRTNPSPPSGCAC